MTKLWKGSSSGELLKLPSGELMADDDDCCCDDGGFTTICETTCSDNPLPGIWYVTLSGMTGACAAYNGTYGCDSLFGVFQCSTPCAREYTDGTTEIEVCNELGSVRVRIDTPETGSFLMIKTMAFPRVCRTTYTGFTGSPPACATSISVTLLIP